MRTIFKTQRKEGRHCELRIWSADWNINMRQTDWYFILGKGEKVSSNELTIKINSHSSGRILEFETRSPSYHKRLIILPFEMPEDSLGDRQRSRWEVLLANGEDGGNWWVVWTPGGERWSTEQEFCLKQQTGGDKKFIFPRILVDTLLSFCCIVNPCVLQLAALPCRQLTARTGHCFSICPDIWIVTVLAYFRVEGVLCNYSGLQDNVACQYRGVILLQDTCIETSSSL